VRVVVAEDGVGARLACPLHDADRVRALGDQVAHQDDPIVGRAPHPRQQRVQFVETAVNVADDDGAHGRGGARRAVSA